MQSSRPLVIEREICRKMVYPVLKSGTPYPRRGRLVLLLLVLLAVTSSVLTLNS